MHFSPALWRCAQNGSTEPSTAKAINKCLLSVWKEQNQILNVDNQCVIPITSYPLILISPRQAIQVVGSQSDSNYNANRQRKWGLFILSNWPNLPQKLYPLGSKTIPCLLRMICCCIKDDEDDGDDDDDDNDGLPSFPYFSLRISSLSLSSRLLARLSTDINTLLVPVTGWKVWDSVYHIPPELSKLWEWRKHQEVKPAHLRKNKDFW